MNIIIRWGGAKTIKQFTEYKMENPIFIDSSFFKGLIDIKDDFNESAIKIWENFRQKKIPLITSNFILDETFTLIRVKCRLSAAMELRERILAGAKRIKIIRISVSDESKAWNWFQNEWKNLSYTDCTSFAVMKRLGITDVATFDEHFGKAGFKIIK